MRYSLALAAVALLLNGCAAHQVAQIDPSSQMFPSRIVIPPRDIAINKPYEDLSRAQFVVVRALTNVDHEKYQEFAERSVAQMGVNVMSPADYARMIEERGITDATATLDAENLRRVYRHVGPFLVMTFLMERAGAVNHRVLVYNPESNEPLFHARRVGALWASLDVEYSYPMLNALRDWVIASGGLGGESLSPYVAGPVERTVNGWHVDALSRSRHLVSEIVVPGRVSGLRPVHHGAYDGDNLNVSLEFHRDDPPLWMSLYVYPRFHGQPEPEDELRLSIHNSLQARGGEVKLANRGDVAIGGVRRPAWAANLEFDDDGHRVANWTIVVPTRAWYIKVLSSELVREGVEPGADAFAHAGRLLSALGVPDGAFDAIEPADDGGFRLLDAACERVHCLAPRTVSWMRNDGTTASRELGVPVPVVDEGTVSLHVGDRVYLELVGEETIAVPAVRDPARTLTLELVQEDGRPDTLLRVTNPFDVPIKYSLSVQPSGYQDVYPLVTCPVDPGRTGTEAWPYAIPRLELTGFRRLGPADPVDCVH